MVGHHYKATYFVSGAIMSLLMAGSAYAASNGVIAYPCRDRKGWQNICYINENGRHRVQKTFMTYGADALPSWDPTGQNLAFTQLDGRRGTLNIVTMNSKGKNAKVIAAGVAPAWSPDGNSIAFLRPNPDGTSEIWVMNPDGSNQHKVTTTDLPKGQMTWSPDSKLIAFAQYDPSGHKPSIWVMKADGSNSPQELTKDKSFVNLDVDGNVINTAADAGSPNWSPTANTIAFWSGVEGQAGQIWVIDSDGTNRTELTMNPSSNNDDPAWSADGKKILFSTNYHEGPGNQAMWVMNADGGDQHKITENTSNPLPGDAAWQPVQ